MPRKLTTEEFIKRAKKIHGDKYDYSKVEYKGNRVKVCIICPEHGEFWQVPSSHLRGIGCAKCGGVGKSNTEEFIEKARKIHGDKYEYSKVDYRGSKTKVCIICPEHGEFWQTPSDHLNRKGCIKCSNSEKYTINDFIQKSSKIHGNKYDYSKVDYVNAHTKVCIICPKHGEFWQTPDNHYRWGCLHCKESSLEKNVELTLNYNNIKFEKQKKFSWLVYKKEMPLDFYLPDYNAAIECQGDQHFSPFRYKNGDRNFKIRQDRDLVKKILCESHKVKLYYYSENEKYNELNNIKIFHNITELINTIKDECKRF